MCKGPLQGAQAVADYFDVVTVPNEVARDDIAHGRIVVDDKDMPHGSRLGALAGSPKPVKDSVSGDGQ